MTVDEKINQIIKVLENELENENDPIWRSKIEMHLKYLKRLSKDHETLEHFKELI